MSRTTHHRIRRFEERYQEGYPRAVASNGRNKDLENNGRMGLPTIQI